MNSCKETGTAYYKHRDVWEEKFGKIPDGLFLCHKCDNPKCINTDHMFLGTHADNMKDMALKGRSGTKKLTEKQVIELRNKWENGGVSQRELAKEYGMSQTGVRYILNGRNRKYLSFKEYSGKRPPGNRNLTKEQIKEMKKKYFSGRKMASLAKEYGISLTTTWRAIHGKRE